MSGWNMVPLREIARPKQWPTLTKSELSADGYPVYGANGPIGYHDSFTHAERTILIGCRGSCGTIHITPPHAYANGNAMALDALDTNAVDINFLADFFRWRGFSDVITGTSQPQIIAENLRKVLIPTPPLPEQRRIAAILDKADALRTQRREALAQLDRLAQAIFVEMFGDPVRNPKGWDITKFGAVGNLDRGVSKHRPRNDPKLLGGCYPLIQTGDVANSGGYIRDFESTYSDFGLQQSKLWPRGTLCITIAANIAKTGILTFDACFPDSVVGFSASQQSTVEYVRVWLSFLQKTLEENAPESAQKNINLSILRDLDIPLPPERLREKFGLAIQSMNEVSSRMAAAGEQLDLMFSSLQHRAFRGEL